MKVKVRVHQQHYRFLYHLAQEDGATSEFGDYFSSLAWTAAQLHPDFRFCPSEECCADVYPTVSTQPMKYVGNPMYCTKSTTVPTEHCPECGAKTITLEEHLDRVDACTKWVARMRALVAVERRFPPRKNDEPLGKDPAPNVRLVVEDVVAVS